MTLLVACRSGGSMSGRWGPVGRLDRTETGFRFLYTHGAQTLDGFAPFPEMPDLNAVYESGQLFPFFHNRLLASSRPEYEASLVWGGFDPADPPDPVVMLGVTEGRRATDSYEVFPCPLPDAEGCYINKFFLHGIRWMPPAALERIGKLQREEPLGLMLDVSNKHDPYAVAVRTCDAENRFMIGYVPRYLAGDVRDLCKDCEPDFIALTVERVNADAPLQQRVLCRMRSCWPGGFQPCSRQEFQPIVSSI